MSLFDAAPRLSVWSTIYILTRLDQLEWANDYKWSTWPTIFNIFWGKRILRLNTKMCIYGLYIICKYFICIFWINFVIKKWNNMVQSWLFRCLFVIFLSVEWCIGRLLATSLTSRSLPWTGLCVASCWKGTCEGPRVRLWDAKILTLISIKYSLVWNVWFRNCQRKNLPYVMLKTETFLKNVFSLT